MPCESLLVVLPPSQPSPVPMAQEGEFTLRSHARGKASPGRGNSVGKGLASKDQGHLTPFTAGVTSAFELSTSLTSEQTHPTVPFLPGRGLQAHARLLSGDALRFLFKPHAQLSEGPQVKFWAATHSACQARHHHHAAFLFSWDVTISCGQRRKLTCTGR